MEFLLLWIDDLDDAVGALRHLAPKILGLLFAVVLFAGTVLALSLAPQATLAVAACVMSASLVEVARRRRGERLNSPQN
jgi:hypothetical protein